MFQEMGFFAQKLSSPICSTVADDLDWKMAKAVCIGYLWHNALSLRPSSPLLTFASSFQSSVLSFRAVQAKAANPGSPKVAMQYMAAKTAHISGVLASRLYRYAFCFAQTMRVPLSSACRKSATFIAEMMQYHCGHGGKSVH
jgi:hypothetical protein